MKKIILCLLFLCMALNVNAQENGFQWDSHPWTLGVGADYGLNTREDFALGYGISFERYLFCPWLGLGVRGMMYNDSQSISATEATVTLRLWMPETPGMKRTFFFTQWGFGAVFYREEDRDINSYVMDMIFGCRIHLDSGNRFFIEPYVRNGFPFMFSAGISAGRRFDF